MNTRIATLAGYTLLEAARTRLPFVLAAAIVLLLASSFFVQELALTESARARTAVYAAGMRFACVFIAAMHVIASLLREFNDKGLDVALALDLPRSHYIAGKLAGFLAMGALIAAAASLPLVFLATAESALQWGLSLALELAIVVALALFGILIFEQVMPAAGLVLAFYLLARTLTAIRLMSAEPLIGGNALSYDVMRELVEALALLVPDFGRWTQTAWVVDRAADWTEVGALFVHALVYLVLLTAAAMFDFYRKDL